MANEKGTKPRKGGAPSKFRPEYVELARKCCAILGATNDQLAEFFGVSDTTVDNWIKSIPEFKAAIIPARAQADANVQHSLYRCAMGYSHRAEKIFYDSKAGKVVRVPYIEHYKPDNTAQIFWLKNRQRDLWKDVQPEGGGGTDEERAQKLREALDEMVGSVEGPPKPKK